MRKPSNHEGEVYNRWTIIKIINGKKCIAKCECGNEKEVYTNNIISGKSKSCGCLARENNAKRMTTHGESKTKLYKVWRGIKTRCTDSKSKSYVFYGGRGIKMYDEWYKSYEIFSKWCYENGYKDGLEIDRIDVNKNYEPSNCRFVTRLVNANNKRDNHYLTINGESHTIAEWSRIKNISQNLIIGRLKRNWSLDDIFKSKTEDRDGRFKPTHFELINGELLSFSEICKKYGFKIGCIRSRYKKGLRGNELIKPLTPMNKPRKEWDKINENLRKSTKITN